MYKNHNELLTSVKKNGVQFPDNVEKFQEEFLFSFKLRLIQQLITDEYHAKSEMRCPVHLCHGQELLYGGLIKLLVKDDILFSHHRSHGSYFAKGGSLKHFFLELLGKINGACNGYSGSQDISSVENNMHAGAIVTGSNGLVTGAAYSIRRSKKAGILALSIFGEGAADQGLFYESLNYAALKNLPIVYICENNSFATYSRMDQHLSTSSLEDRVKAQGLMYMRCSTFIPKELFICFENAFRLARIKNTPIFIEVLTYRYSPHVGPADDTASGYRTHDEINQWMSIDPLDSMLSKYHNANWMPSFKNKVKFLENEIRQCYEEARLAPPAVEIPGSVLSNQHSAISNQVPILDIKNFINIQSLTTPGPY
jgi:pyruvate dehydrogenase E1 component alpha subunit